MNDLQKQFEEEAIQKFNNSEVCSMSYVEWLESQLTWRKVEDGLPDYGVEVLICCEAENESNYTSMKGTTGSLGTKAWITPLDDYYKEDEIKVTHWLPIPELS